jgi:hypothetical protein
MEEKTDGGGHIEENTCRADLQVLRPGAWSPEPVAYWETFNTPFIMSACGRQRYS